MNKKYKYTKEELQEVVLNSGSIRQCLIKLNMKPAGGNYQTLHERFKEWNIDTSHFHGQGWNIGLKFRPTKRKPMEEILVRNSKFRSSHLKKRLFDESYKDKKCELCLLSEWLNNPIPLELHHIDGDKYNNEIENLQILCPNCHALTDTYRGKNILSARKEISLVESPKFRETLTGNPEPSLLEEGAET